MIKGQLSLDLFPEYSPLDCVYQGKTIHSGKCECLEMGLWTNCIQWGSCTSDHKKHNIKYMEEE